MKRALLAVAALGVGSGVAGFAPVPARLEVRPGQVASSKPGPHGLVTQLRPVVTRLAPGGPFRIALHWVREKTPLRPGDVPGAVARDATLRTMTFHLTTPAGEKLALRPVALTPDRTWASELYYSPTYLLTLTKDGVEGQGGKWSWVGAKRPDLAREGAYRLSVKGELVRQGGAAIPFESEPILLEVSRKVLPQEKAVAAARAALRAQQPGLDVAKAHVLLRDDEKGNLLVRFRTPGKLWSYVDWSVPVRPDGKVERATSKETFTCVARGTMIATEKGPRPVEEVRVGDRVWGLDARARRKVLTAVQFIRVGEAQHTVLLAGRLRVTAEHPVWVGAWRQAGHVGAQDRLLDEGGRRVPAGEPRWLSGRVQVFDLTVDEPHCFFAAGLLVHNKSRRYSPRLDDPWYDLWPELLPGK